MTVSCPTDDIAVDIVRKKIKNLYLRVQPPDGRVVVSAPLRMSANVIHQFVQSRADWIHTQRQRIRAHAQLIATQPMAIPGHVDIWGVRYPLHTVERSGPARAEFRENKLIVLMRSDASRAVLREVIARWHLRELQNAVPPMIAKWEAVMNVRVTHVSIRHMKTRWGSCSPRSGRIRLNLELAKRHPTSLEYVIVHELVHLLEASHNHRFVALMDRFMPEWRRYKAELVNKGGAISFEDSCRHNDPPFVFQRF